MFPPSIGPLLHYVNDFSGIVSPEKLQELDILFQNIETQTGKQIVTVIFPHRDGKELLDIGVELFNQVGIGNKKLNNGLLLLISSEEKKLRIIVGKGLEFVYSDEWCKGVIENTLRPLLNEGKYEELIVKWKELCENNTGSTVPVTRKKSGGFYIIISILSFYGIPLLGFVSAQVFPKNALYLYLAIFLFGIFLLKSKVIKSKFIGTPLLIILIYSFFSVLPIVLIFHFEAKDKEFCIKNPVVCEERKIAEEKIFCDSRPESCINNRIDYDSSDYKSYEAEQIRESQRSSSSSSSSPSSSSPSFGGGGGSTNGAGAGD